jgi:hypothetical protein
LLEKSRKTNAGRYEPISGHKQVNWSPVTTMFNKCDQLRVSRITDYWPGWSWSAILVLMSSGCTLSDLPVLSVVIWRTCYAMLYCSILLAISVMEIEAINVYISWAKYRATTVVRNLIACCCCRSRIFQDIFTLTNPKHIEDAELVANSVDELVFGLVLSRVSSSEPGGEGLRILRHFEPRAVPSLWSLLLLSLSLEMSVSLRQRASFSWLSVFCLAWCCPKRDHMTKWCSRSYSLAHLN